MVSPLEMSARCGIKSVVCNPIGDQPYGDSIP
jgi:hypothetical protein